MNADPVIIRYKNWRGEVTERRISPLPSHVGFWLYLSRNSWHPDPQWLFDAFDHDRGAVRTFAMSGVLSWPGPPPAEASS